MKNEHQRYSNVTMNFDSLELSMMQAKQMNRRKENSVEVYGSIIQCTQLQAVEMITKNWF